MMVMTAKVNFKKLALIAIAVVAAIVVLSLVFGGSSEAAPTVAGTVSDNDSRVKFLKDLGWEVTNSPTESGQVKIPETQSDVYSRYNALQKSQGYDLSAYGGKTVMRYVYRVNNYPGATEPVYATLLVYKNKIIGGDITDTAAKGQIRGLEKLETVTPPSTEVPEATATT